MKETTVATLDALTTATPAERTEAIRALQALATGEPCTHDFFEGFSPEEALEALEALED